ncbi:kynurenine formamidase [Lycorma delicatula]|uniref:kynurenine formamidase n=1 Tax=Lycorma delicatula TaxID=130591 RepID=UPI003F50D921
MVINNEIEHQYMPSRWSKRYPADKVVEIHKSFVKNASNYVRKVVPHKTDIRYGAKKGQCLDIYGEDSLQPDSDIFVYIHGGYWQSLSKDISSYCVKPLFDCGVKTIIPGYDLAPKVNMHTLVEEVKDLAGYVLNTAESCNSCAVWFGGHSAGAHLTAQLFNDDYLSTLKDNHKKIFKGLILISGIYDLTPIINTSVNEVLNLTKTEIEQYSPLINATNKLSVAKSIGCKALVAVAENDSPEFQRQSKEFAEVLTKCGANAKYIKMKNEDHFSIVENLQDPNYNLTKDIIQLIKSKT